MRHALLLTLSLSALAAQPAVPPGHVTLPLPDYDRLIEQAAQASARPGAPPQAYALHAAAFDLRVEKDAVSGTLTLPGEVLRKGPVRIPLAAGLTVFDAREGGGRPLAISQPDGTHAAVIDGPAEFRVQLDCGLPLSTEPGRAGFVLPALAAGAVRLSLTLPGEQTAVTVTPGLVTERNSSGGRTTIQATLVPGKQTTVWWSARNASPAATPKDLRFLSDIKTLVSVTETETALTALADVTVVQGESSTFTLTIPEGYEVTSVTGATLAGSDARSGRVALEVTSAATRSHQFLVALVKSAAAPQAEITLPGFEAAQRETGEVLIESQGALELAAQEKGGLRRMDLREISPVLRSLADHSVQTAFRYQRRAAEPPAVALTWVRFPAMPFLPALSDQAVVTTLVTREGRSLTEVKLTVRNQTQAFVRVALPAGASIVTAEVAGERVKPVLAADGARVPLQRAGFRPTGAYAVSFVFSHAGAPFAKKGAGEIVLPRLDLPVGAVEWEVFLPAEFRVGDFGGDVLPAHLMARIASDEPAAAPAFYGGVGTGGPIGTGPIGGTVVDPTGAPIPHVRVVVTHADGQQRETTADAQGAWRVAPLPAGSIRVAISAPGFRTTITSYAYRGNQPLTVTSKLDVGTVSESVEVSSGRGSAKDSGQAERPQRLTDQAASVNVMDLQKRLAGVLPIAVTVPRTGQAYRFVRPVVVDEETKLTFQYRAGK